jgi:ABC-type lipoprotein export system ATPase subunit
VLITHSPELAEETDRIISIRDGNIVSEVVKRDVDARENASAEGQVD